jgi:CRISPR-associated protein Cas2
VVVSFLVPFYIAVYDVNVKRVAKMLKIFRRYMTWIQNSVFEGELTEAQFQRLQAEARALMEPDEDSVIFYQLGNEKYVGRIALGQERGEPGRML